MQWDLRGIAVYKTLALRSGFIATVLGLLYPHRSLGLGV